MKKLIALMSVPFLLNACSGTEYVHSSEPRSNVYYGQPVADLYENFGTPTRGTRLSENERVLIYLQQEIEKDWAYRYVRGCVMKFHLKDERVIDWSAEGQSCVISSGTKPGSVLSQIDANGINKAQEKLMQQKTEAQGGNVPKNLNTPASINYASPQYAGQRITLTSEGVRLPDDAFMDNTVSTIYNPAVAGVYDQQIVLPSGAVAYTRSPASQAGNYQTSTMMFPKGSEPKIPVPAGVNVSSPALPQLPADAFNGSANTGYTTPATGVQPAPQPQQKSIFSSWFSSNNDEDDWGLFD